MASGSKGNPVLEETNLEPRITMHTTDDTTQGPQIMPSIQYSVLPVQLPYLLQKLADWGLCREGTKLQYRKVLEPLPPKPTYSILREYLVIRTPATSMDPEKEASIDYQSTPGPFSGCMLAFRSAAPQHARPEEHLPTSITTLRERAEVGIRVATGRRVLNKTKPKAP